MTDRGRGLGSAEERGAPDGGTVSSREFRARAEALRAIEAAHEWLERVEEHRTCECGQRTYIGLDHRLGQNVDGCTYCHAAAVLYGLAEPVDE